MGVPASVGAWIDGAMPFRAETIRGYLQAMHQQYLADLATKEGLPASQVEPATIETRFVYNQDFYSIYAMVPGTIAFLLILIPAILMALAIVREKELGSITNLYVTPVTRIEFLLGKQLPYVAIGMTSFTILFLMAIFVFAVPIKGSVPMLFVGALLYVITTTGYGMLISSFASSQIAALFGTAILSYLPAFQFSGMMTPVSSLTGIGAFMGKIFPMTYFLPISVGTFTKALGFADLSGNLFSLAIFAVVLFASQSHLSSWPRNLEEVHADAPHSPIFSGSEPRNCAASCMTMSWSDWSSGLSHSRYTPWRRAAHKNFTMGRSRSSTKMIRRFRATLSKASISLLISNRRRPFRCATSTA